ncbi:flagellar hook-length control protein FliK [Cellulomonas sp. APG4]|uniref:flagellar hook-length control protein FliK n=1 Tax=Cellulomonas sp. APG4 TaxID=1538656 RepID=UPI00137AD7AB|nr:flagellar hook-length control protein FliK [Cellulomonas sp. APG4]NCT92648.1 flagellar hook-length control protein FliK [Cellulomonas sp. APG4]
MSTTIAVLPAPRPAPERSERPADRAAGPNDDFARTLDAASRAERHDDERPGRTGKPAARTGGPADAAARPARDNDAEATSTDRPTDGAAGAGDGQAARGPLTVAQIVQASAALLEGVGGIRPTTPQGTDGSTSAEVDGAAVAEGATTEGTGTDATSADAAATPVETDGAVDGAAPAPVEEGGDTTAAAVTVRAGDAAPTTTAVTGAAAATTDPGTGEGTDTGEGATVVDLAARRAARAAASDGTVATTTDAGRAASSGTELPADTGRAAAAATPVQVTAPTAAATDTSAAQAVGQASAASSSAPTAETSAPSAPSGPPAQAAEAKALADQLGVRLAALRTAAQGEHVLTLRVDPESMGPVKVVAHIGADGVRIELLGGTDQAREALRAALPDLRRDLVAAGLSPDLELGTGASDQGGPGSGDADATPGHGATSSGTPAGPTDDETSAPRSLDRSLGRLDLLV